MRKTQAYLTNGFGIEFFTVVYRGKEYLFRKLSRMFTDVNDVLYVTEDNCIERRYIRYKIYCGSHQSPWDNYHMMMYYTWPVTPILALKHQVVIITLKTLCQMFGCICKRRTQFRYKITMAISLKFILTKNTSI